MVIRSTRSSTFLLHRLLSYLCLCRIFKSSSSKYFFYFLMVIWRPSTSILHVNTRCSPCSGDELLNPRRSPDPQSPIQASGKHSQIGAYFLSRFIHRQPRSVAVTASILTQRGDKLPLTEQPRLLIGQDGQACGNAKEAFGGVYSFRFSFVAPEAKYPTTKASLSPGWVDVLFQLVADARH